MGRSAETEHKEVVRESKKYIRIEEDISPKPTKYLKQKLHLNLL